MIATAKNKTAGLVVVCGVLLFVVAIGVNMIYSMETVCLDSLPPKCFTGYDSLSESQRMILSPGLYIVAAAVGVTGAVLWFRKDIVLQER
jgi:hypothetical protein